jgi:hypothetical protein
MDITNVTVVIGARKSVFVPAPGCRFTPKVVGEYVAKRDEVGMTMVDRENSKGWVPMVRGENQGEYTAEEDRKVLSREKGDAELSFEIHRTIHAIRCRRWALVALQPTHSASVRDVWVTVNQVV